MNLIREHKRYLRVQEERLAKFGQLACPPEVITGSEDARRAIAELEQRIRRRIPHSGTDTHLYSDEEVEEIADKMQEIALLKDRKWRMEKVLSETAKHIEPLPWYLRWLTWGPDPDRIDWVKIHREYKEKLADIETRLGALERELSAIYKKSAR